ncbi:hypothetical protein [Paenibacillus radicis (ex Gao et al. 2016)]|uniref:Uncharacterized protein n=1 Tax=Paenibacillus radicis (ex Gao et al. 2016) TaxID=1737354 RepID=A0A917LYW8_9BACL|nr:hypothetical protein [Paenibacillus radicis (ex Gao et al. 2016)]GGG67964.1 hypothetical protein GCM10010918_23430 [Paenibacillus radicis (ex Gao et al. 2016)]
MSDPNTEWMRKLKETDPLREKTFTPEKMEAIVMKTVHSRRKSPRNKQKPRVFAYTAAIAVAAVLLVGILPSGPYTGWLLNAFGGGWNVGEQAMPPISSVPPTETGQPETEPPSETASPTLTGKLREHLPFSTESEMTISIHDNQSGGDYQVPAGRNYVILQSLNWVDLTFAKAPKADSETSVFLRFTVDNQSYEIPYRLETNTVEWMGQSFYMDDGTMLLMHRLLQPQSKLGIIAQLFEQAQQEQENDQVERSNDVYASDRLEVNGRDYNGWEKELEKLIPKSEQNYYNIQTEKMDNIRQYESGILTLNLSVVFEDSTFQTKDNIRVGSTEAEVLKALGKPNLKSASKWSYQIGDFNRFHLYFQDGKVAYVVLTLPL